MTKGYNILQEIDVHPYNMNIKEMTYAVGKKALMLDKAGEYGLALDAIKDAKNYIHNPNIFAPYTETRKKVINVLDKLEIYFEARKKAMEHLEDVMNRLISQELPEV